MGLVETAVTMFRVGGHNHNGINSTKVDFVEYTESDLAPILSKIRKGQEYTTSGSALTGFAVFTFSFPVVVGSVASPIFFAPSTLTVATIHFAASSVPTTGAATVDIYKNATKQLTLTLNQNSRSVAQPCSISYTKDSDYFQAILTATGGGTDFVVQARL